MEKHWNRVQRLVFASIYRKDVDVIHSIRWNDDTNYLNLLFPYRIFIPIGNTLTARHNATTVIIQKYPMRRDIASIKTQQTPKVSKNTTVAFKTALCLSFTMITRIFNGQVCATMRPVFSQKIEISENLLEDLYERSVHETMPYCGKLILVCNHILAGE